MANGSTGILDAPQRFIDRFWANVDKTPTCWLWMRFVSPKGYGIASVAPKRQTGAHRVSYELTVGPIPKGMFIDHTCHNKRCVRPDHLRLATNKQNLENLSGPYRTNRVGIRGVRVAHLVGGDRFQGRVRHNGTLYWTPWFDTAEEAGEAAADLRRQLFTHNLLDRVS